MTLDALHALLLDRPAASWGQPFGPEIRVYKVGGKMFATLGEDADPPRMNLKCDPELATQLRQAWPAILPGWHMNKRHWNTVVSDGTLPRAELEELVAHSYDLVARNLTQKLQKTLREQGWELSALTED